MHSLINPTRNPLSFAAAMDPTLYKAATTGNLKLLSEVAEDNIEALLSKAPHENTALHIAARHGHVEFIKDMLGRCPQLLRVKNSQGDTALHQALRNVQVDLAIELFRRDPELAFITNNAQESPLHLAVQEQLQQVVRAMLGCGATPTNYSATLEDRKTELVAIKDSTGRTALHYAAWRNDADTVDIILGIDCHTVPYATDEGGFSPLHVAAAFGSLGSISKLLERCPDAIEQLDQKGRNALHIAVLNRKKKTIEKLMKTPNAGHKLNEQDQDGNTPLHVAALDEIDQLADFKSSILYTLARDQRATLKMMNKSGQTVEDLCVRGSSALKQANGGEDATNRQPRMMSAVIPEEKNVKDQQFQWDSRENTKMLVGTLIATVSFAAGITVPGGFRNDEPNPGTAILTRKAAFQAFILFDSVALFSSISSIFITGWMRRFGSPISGDETLNNCINFWAFCFMMFAFGMGVYVVVLPRCKWLAILVCFLSFTIPFVIPFATVYDEERQARKYSTSKKVEDPENPI